MTNDETAFREVDEAVAEAQQLQFLRKYGALLMGGAVAAIAAVAGFQIWQGQQNAAAVKAATEFESATETLAKAPEDGRLALEAFSAEAPEGYALMADFRRASSMAGGGDRAGGLAVFRKIYADTAVPKRLRDLARLRAGLLAVNDGREAVVTDLGEVPSRADAMSYYAREILGLAALQAKDYESALAEFKKAKDDVAAPEPVRLRAAEFHALAAAGKAGVNLTGETRLEDLAKALDAAGGAPAPANETPPQPPQP